MNQWKNVGDINPENGARLIKDMYISTTGDFTCEAVDVNCESNIGGSDNVFLLSHGSLFLSKKNMASALDTIGAKLDGDMIVIQDHYGNDESHKMDSEQGLMILADAAYAYSGIEDPDEVVVSIGMPEDMAPRNSWNGELVLFPDKTNLWAVMRKVLDGFDYVDFSEKDKPQEAEILNGFGLFENFSRNIQTRNELMSLPVFAEMNQDDAGNPIVWENHYEHVDCKEMELGEDDNPSAPTWTMEWSCQCNDACPCCGAEIEPHESKWIGPENQMAKDLWEKLEDSVKPSYSFKM